MRKADRLFQLVNLIRVHQPICAQTLASRIGVSVRSIYRYIDDLSISGIPIYGTPGVGYALGAGFQLPPLSLSPLELDALMLGMDMLSTCADPDTSAAARRLLSKVCASSERHKVDPRNAKLRALGTTPAETRDHLGLLRSAIEHAHAVHIAYTRPDGVTSERLIIPLGLFYWGGKWTVGSWCEVKGAYRDFRVDRMACVVIASRPLADNPALDIHVYMAHRAAEWKEVVATDNTLSVATADNRGP